MKKKKKAPSPAHRSRRVRAATHSGRTTEGANAQPDRRAAQWYRRRRSANAVGGGTQEGGNRGKGVAPSPPTGAAPHRHLAQGLGHLPPARPQGSSHKGTARRAGRAPQGSRGISGRIVNGGEGKEDVAGRARRGPPQAGGAQLGGRVGRNLPRAPRLLRHRAAEMSRAAVSASQPTSTSRPADVSAQPLARPPAAPPLPCVAARVHQTLRSAPLASSWTRWMPRLAQLRRRRKKRLIACLMSSSICPARPPPRCCGAWSPCAFRKARRGGKARR